MSPDLIEMFNELYPDNQITFEDCRLLDEDVILIRGLHHYRRGATGEALMKEHLCYK